MNECYMNKINLNNIFDIIPNELVEHIFFSPFRRDFYVRRTCKNPALLTTFQGYLKLKVTNFFTNNPSFLEKVIDEGYSVSLKTFMQH